MASSVIGHKRSQAQRQLSPSCICMVCLGVLYDPLTLLCGHSLDQGCLQKVLDSRVARACPTCRAPLPRLHEMSTLPSHTHMYNVVCDCLREVSWTYRMTHGSLRHWTNKG
jgi:hypothetical protein